MTIKRKSYKFRLYPNQEQKQLFAKTFGCSRAIWNMMLADKIKHYENTKETLYNRPAQYKKEFPWLREVDSLALNNVQLNLQTAYKNFFRSGFGFPKFKKKSHRQSYKTNNQNGTIALLDGKVKLPKIGWVRVKAHRQIDGVIKSATISMTSTGKYHISILCETEIAPLPKTNSSVGVDLGISDFAILSTGEKIGKIITYNGENAELFEWIQANYDLLEFRGNIKIPVAQLVSVICDKLYVRKDMVEVANTWYNFTGTHDGFLLIGEIDFKVEGR